MTKVCSRCKEEKPFSDFSKDRTRKDGIRGTCRACAREQNREYYKRNREKTKEQVRKYKEENREKIRELNRKYREENRDYYLLKRRENRRKKNKVSNSMATKSGRWSQEEVALLVELSKTRTIYQCAIELGRGYESTQKKIRSLRKNGVEV